MTRPGHSNRPNLASAIAALAPKRGKTDQVTQLSKYAMPPAARHPSLAKEAEDSLPSIKEPRVVLAHPKPHYAVAIAAVDPVNNRR
jgi:hypothetical protein